MQLRDLSRLRRVGGTKPALYPRPHMPVVIAPIDRLTGTIRIAIQAPSPRMGCGYQGRKNALTEDRILDIRDRGDNRLSLVRAFGR